MRMVIPYTDRLLNLPNQNFRTMMEAIVAIGVGRGLDVRCIAESDLMSEDNADIVLSIRTIGIQSEAHIQHYKRNGIRIVMWHDDILKHWARTPLVYVPRNGPIAHFLERADLAFLPCFHQGMKFSAYRRFQHKCVWMPWSVPDVYFDTARRPWSERKDAVLLSGKISWQYRLRRRI
ncbi:MAG: hypothetical protein IT440_12415, partial [Phycisphaeraceae bacterium]|nr:hypothetical protein [Phycisphaeraceae bacterium]